MLNDFINKWSPLSEVRCICIRKYIHVWNEMLHIRRKIICLQADSNNTKVRYKHWHVSTKKTSTQIFRATDPRIYPNAGPTNPIVFRIPKLKQTNIYTFDLITIRRDTHATFRISKRGSFSHWLPGASERGGNGWKITPLHFC